MVAARIQTQSINHLLTAYFHSPGSPCTSFSTPRYVGGSGCHNCRVLQAVLVILGKKPSFFLWKEWKFLHYIAVEKSGNKVWNQEMKSGMWNAETDLAMTPSQQNKVWKFNHTATFIALLNFGTFWRKMCSYPQSEFEPINPRKLKQFELFSLHWPATTVHHITPKCHSCARSQRAAPQWSASDLQHQAIIRPLKNWHDKIKPTNLKIYLL